MTVEHDRSSPRVVAVEDSRVVHLAYELSAGEVSERQRPRQAFVVAVHVGLAGKVSVDMTGAILEGACHLGQGIPEDLQKRARYRVILFFDDVVGYAPHPNGAPEGDALIPRRDRTLGAGGFSGDLLPRNVLEDPERAFVELQTGSLRGDRNDLPRRARKVVGESLATMTPCTGGGEAELAAPLRSGTPR